MLISLSFVNFTNLANLADWVITILVNLINLDHLVHWVHWVNLVMTIFLNLVNLVHLVNLVVNISVNLDMFYYLIFTQILQTGPVDKIKRLCICLLRKRKLAYSLSKTYIFMNRTSSKFLKCKI